MSDQFVNAAQEGMGAIEKLLKGLPGIKGYVDKELRRDADKRLRNTIAAALEEQKHALFALQTKLMKSGGLAMLDEMDSVIQKVQILIDRIKTASYGYAGLFDPVKIKAEQLNALHRFDVALAQRTAEAASGVQAIEAAIGDQGDVAQAVEELAKKITELNSLVGRRSAAIASPDLLMDTDYLPEVDPKLMEQ